MTTESALIEAVRGAWSLVPPPPLEDLRYMTWGWGEEAYRAFAGVAPMDVDIDSAGFMAATPLLDLPPRAAAAYLGTFLLKLLKELEGQRAVGIYVDVLGRAHTIACLEQPFFWEQVVRPHLSAGCRKVLADVVAYLTTEAADVVPLTPEQVEELRVLATG